MCKRCNIEDEYKLNKFLYESSKENVDNLEEIDNLSPIQRFLAENKLRVKCLIFFILEFIKEIIYPQLGNDSMNWIKDMLVICFNRDYLKSMIDYYRKREVELAKQISSHQSQSQ